MQKSRLNDVPFLSKLKRKEQQLFAQLADELDVPAGKVLARQGEFGDQFFVIEAGTADVSRDGEHVGELGPGDFFGEIALVREERRNATVTAKTPMTVIVMTRASFRAIDRAMPHVHAAVQEAIERRLSAA